MSAPSKLTGVTMQKLGQNVTSFREQANSSAEEWQSNCKHIIRGIISERNTIVVTKSDQLMDLISDAVDQQTREYLLKNVAQVKSFIIESTQYFATLIRKIPNQVVEDLVSSSEFIFGNLWFMLPLKYEKKENSTNADDVLGDVQKIFPSAFAELPALIHETIASPAMYDGCEIIWFNPNAEVYDKVISQMF